MALSTIEKILFLKSVPLFDQFHSEELIDVAQIAQQVEIPAGETLVRQGERGECLYIIIDGEAEATMDHVGLVSEVGPKSSLGDIAVVSEEPQSATYTATREIVALKIEREDFWDLMSEQPKIAFGVIKVLVDHLNRVIEKLQMQQPSRRGITNVPLDLWEALEDLE